MCTLLGLILAAHRGLILGALLGLILAVHPHTFLYILLRLWNVPSPGCGIFTSLPRLWNIPSPGGAPTPLAMQGRFLCCVAELCRDETCLDFKSPRIAIPRKQVGQESGTLQRLIHQGGGGAKQGVSGLGTLHNLWVHIED